MLARTMTVWFVAVVPVLIMFFALAMERLEDRLRHLTLHENEVEEFLRAARPDEVQALFGSGIGGALELFRLRRRPRRPKGGAVYNGTSPGSAAHPGTPHSAVPHSAAPQRDASSAAADLVTSPSPRQRS